MPLFIFNFILKHLFLRRISQHELKKINPFNQAFNSQKCLFYFVKLSANSIKGKSEFN